MTTVWPEAAMDDNYNDKSHIPLQVAGIDSVDDESKSEHIKFDCDTPLPDKWQQAENPPYSYYIYFMYANMVVLNQFRRYSSYRLILFLCCVFSNFVL